MDRNQKIIAGILIVAVLVVVVALSYRYVIKGHGKIATLNCEVYGEEELINLVTEIDWGTLFAGQEKIADLWILNTGSVAGNLTLATENWTPPEAENYLMLSWDYVTGELAPDESLYVALKLEVFSNATVNIDYNMDIIISITYEE